MYYIISLKHTHKIDKFITLWRPRNAGYCYSQDNAGIYEKIQEGYHNQEFDSMPVLVEELDQLFVKSIIDSNGTFKKCVPNCAAVWEVLGLKMTKNGLTKIIKK